MRLHLLAVACTAALTLGACQNADRFGAGGAGSGGEAGFAPVTPVDPLANAAPNTVTYFNSVVGDRVLFAVDQSTLSDEARTTLAAQAQWLGQNPEFTAIIEGHADEQGTREYNLALGERRASAVRDYLISQGVSGARLRTVTYGKERPIEVCSSEACYAKNRRAVTVVAAGSGAGV